MRTRIIAEIGSTHLGNVDHIYRGIDALVDADVDAVKFQLFPNHSKYTEAGNIYLEPDLFYKAVEHAHGQGLDISASVFDDDSLDILLKTDPKWVKFAFSKKEDLVNIRRVQLLGIEAIVSCDVMSIDKLPPTATRLFCIPQYPVYFNPRFEGIFPRFDGFSDHSLNSDVSCESVFFGAKTLEKHVKLTDRGCPDCAFALSLEEFEDMTTKIRAMEKR